jgi:hypothetical protein
MPLGGTVMAADRLLNVGFEVGDRASGPEAVTRRCEETGMRDLEFGLSGGLSPAFARCKGARTAISGSQGSARSSREGFLSRSLRTLRCFPLRTPPWTASKEVVCPRYHAVGVNGDFAEYSAWSMKAGFGLGILPSDPRRRKCDGIPRPALLT